MAKTKETWGWSIAYKKPKSGRLKWVFTGTQDERKARDVADAYMMRHYNGKGYNRYGWSKTHYEEEPCSQGSGTRKRRRSV